ncbi:MAG: hypothetical protein ABR505_02960 [Actinomycetota bacterium]
MSGRLLRVGGSACFLLILLLYISGIAVGTMQQAILAVEPFSFADVTWPIPMVGFGAVGALIIRRHPRNLIGWLCAGIGLFMVLNFFGQEFAHAAVSSGWSFPFTHLAAWLGFWVWIPGFGLVALFFLLFPTGAPPSPRWRWLVSIVIGLIVASAIAAFGIWDVDARTLLRSPGPSDVPGGAMLDIVANQLLMVAVFLCGLSIVPRFVRARGEERRQLKWVAYAVALFVVSLVFMTLAAAFIFHTEDPVSVPVLGMLTSFANLTIPAATGVAILRYRLYDIDAIINRTLVYGVLTAALLMSYLVIVLTLSRVLDPVTRDSDIAVAASTLAVAALFRPLRSRVQTFIDRRFYRARYDAARSLNEFSSRLRDEIEIDVVRDDVLGVVSSTLQPRHASLWLRSS